MIRRLILLLLIVGCGTEPEDEIKDVAWVLYSNPSHGDNNTLYWTKHFQPQIYDNGFINLAIFNGDSLFYHDSVRNIIHHIELNYFEILEGRWDSELYPEQYELFEYEYK